MNDSRQKAITTRLKRLSDTFEAENGRKPTVAELRVLYITELQSAQLKSRKTYKENGSKGGFRSMSKERRQEVARKAGKASGKARAKLGSEAQG